jgi:Spy/CpxP family protein refolding chaperone
MVRFITAAFLALTISISAAPAFAAQHHAKGGSHMAGGKHGGGLKGLSSLKSLSGVIGLIDALAR